ncbi:7447_t:CDS:10 [Cetraspora pellucida]|uniref:7447_t:CDS:1 n=1 Tax=Cetraspora pellucida TaxID=1433469 RepID=A0A9N8W1R9_9GLOM|nr:7447_t:CDS:10 [Cetraspora pellucida]
MIKNIPGNHQTNLVVNVAKYANPLVGTARDGHVFPGPCLPFGIVKVGFDTDDKSDFNGGYTTHGSITGISHLHVSGTGGEPKYGVISQLPVMDWPDDKLRLDGYSSKRSFEHFEVGYSKFGLKRYKIMVELTASHRTGVHRYTFPPSENDAKVILDLSHILSFGWSARYESAAITSISHNQIKGAGRYKGGWNSDGQYSVFFCSQFNVNATNYATWWNNRINKNTSSYIGVSFVDKIGAILTFDTIKNPVIVSRVGISFISDDQACESAESEVPDWDFDKAKEDAVNAWNKELGRIKVSGGTINVTESFYSSLYRTMIIPSDRTGENPDWKSVDKKGNPIPYYEDFYTLWDTFRTTNPLFTLFQPERAVDITRSLIDTYVHDGYMPDGRSGSWNGITQGGSNADMVVAETYLKNLDVSGKIDWELAYKALIKDAEVDPWEKGLAEGRLYLTDYKKYGYIPFPDDGKTGYANAQCSRTLEYSANDYSISLVSQGLGKINDYIKYRKRATSWENLWCTEKVYDGVKGFIIPKYINGSFNMNWVVDRNFDGGWNTFYEGTSWEYSLDVPFDVKRLIELSGGPKRFEKRLDKTFSDHTFLGNYFNIGNEPDFFHICLYHFVGKQYKSVDIIRKIMETKFGNRNDGIPGNDDSGAMGSWYAFNALGLFPIAGTDIYLINSPHFEEITIYLSISPPITFKIIAHNLTYIPDLPDIVEPDSELNSVPVNHVIINSDTSNSASTATNNSRNSDPIYVNPYVQNVKLNDKIWEKTWFRHSDISKGAIMELQMGPKPSKVWGVVDDEIEKQKDIEDRVVPPSMSDYKIDIVESKEKKNRLADSNEWISRMDIFI